MFDYNCGPLKITQLRALKDNYIYLVAASKGTRAGVAVTAESRAGTAAGNDVVVIDPSEAGPVIKYLDQKKLRLTKILNTHHHPDHVGGNLELKERYKCEIYCSAHDFNRTPGADHKLQRRDRLELFNVPFEVYAVPGHTLGAIVFYSPEAKVAFTGDTLFTLGCGRLFEGTSEQMFNSLKLMRAWPDDTQLFCGHEYTLQNGAFALSIAKGVGRATQESDNSALIEKLQNKLEATKARLAKGLPTVPSSWSEEKALNPFLTAQNLVLFTRLRQLKDEFKLEAQGGMR